MPDQDTSCGTPSPPTSSPPKPRSKARRIGFRVILVLVSISATLVLVEFYLRATQARVAPADGGGLAARQTLISKFGPNGKRLVPNVNVTIHNTLSGEDVHLQTNSHGFRGRELPDQKLQSELRILALGDSITLGAYLPESEVYVGRIEHYLRHSIELRDALRGKTARLLNAGVSGIGIEDEVNILEETGVGLNLDLVLLGFYLNDSRPPWGFSAELGHKGWLRKNSLLSDKIYRTLVLNRWMKEKGEGRFAWLSAVDLINWKHDRKEFLYLASRAKYDWGAAWEGHSWNIIEDQLARLKKFAGKHDFQVAVIAFPVSFQVYASFVEDAPQQRLQEIASEMDFAYLDLLPLLREHNSQQLFYDMCHPNKFTNDLIGKRIAEFIVNDVFPSMNQQSRRVGETK